MLQIQCGIWKADSLAVRGAVFNPMFDAWSDAGVRLPHSPSPILELNQLRTGYLTPYSVEEDKTTRVRRWARPSPPEKAFMVKDHFRSNEIYRWTENV